MAITFLAEILLGASVEDRMGKEDRGFASMDPTKRREIAVKGGKAAHAQGKAHEWTREEAREAGRKGGMASHRRRLGIELTSDQAVENQTTEQS
jgi:general stress protein YciG